MAGQLHDTVWGRLLPSSMQRQNHSFMRCGSYKVTQLGNQLPVLGDFSHNVIALPT